MIPEDGGIISTVERKVLLRYQLESLRGFDNVSILIGAAVSEIISNTSLVLNSGKRLTFKFLIGADGAASIVRRYLGLPTEKLGVAIQYVIPRKLEDFEIHLDEKLFGTGYLWVFPHKRDTSIGCGSDIRFAKPRQLRRSLDLRLKKRGIDVFQARFEAAPINYDYRGYKFGTIFLAGGAAGLTSGLTGKGIYSAFLSGRQVASDILCCRESTPDLIEAWLKKKRQQERFIFFLRNPFLRRVAFSIGMRLASSKQLQEKVMALAARLSSV